MKINEMIKNYEKAANSFETKRSHYQDAFKICNRLVTLGTSPVSRISIEYVRQQIEKITKDKKI